MIKGLVTRVIIVYQRFFSTLTPPTCRFFPSCSSYAIQSIEKHGLIKGLLSVLWRLLRCNPFNPGGFDPVE